MAKVCAITKKGSIIGGGYSNRTRATKFNPTGKVRKYPNLQWTRLPSGPGQKAERVLACAKCIKRKTKV
jgi:ribosomal protein L28